MFRKFVKSSQKCSFQDLALLGQSVMLGINIKDNLTAEFKQRNTIIAFSHHLTIAGNQILKMKYFFLSVLYY